MSAAYGARYVEKIRDGLVQVDPAGSATYTSNAASYIKQLLDLDAELKRQAQTLPQSARKLVTNHDAFPYFAQEYGFVIVGDVLGNPQSEPSAGDLAQLVQKVKQQQVKAAPADGDERQKLDESLARHAANVGALKRELSRNR